MQRGLFKNVLKIRHQGQIAVRAFLKGVEGDDLLEKSLQRIGGGITVYDGPGANDLKTATAVI